MRRCVLALVFFLFSSASAQQVYYWVPGRAMVGAGIGAGIGSGLAQIGKSLEDLQRAIELADQGRALEIAETKRLRAQFWAKYPDKKGVKEAWIRLNQRLFDRDFSYPTSLIAMESFRRIFGVPRNAMSNNPYANIDRDLAIHYGGYGIPAMAQDAFDRVEGAMLNNLEGVYPGGSFGLPTAEKIFDVFKEFRLDWDLSIFWI